MIKNKLRVGGRNEPRTTGAESSGCRRPCSDCHGFPSGSRRCYGSRPGPAGAAEGSPGPLGPVAGVPGSPAGARPPSRESCTS